MRYASCNCVFIIQSADMTRLRVFALRCVPLHNTHPQFTPSLATGENQSAEQRRRALKGVAMPINCVKRFVVEIMRYKFARSRARARCETSAGRFEMFTHGTEMTTHNKTTQHIFTHCAATSTFIRCSHKERTFTRRCRQTSFLIQCGPSVDKRPWNIYVIYIWYNKYYM